VDYTESLTWKRKSQSVSMPREVPETSQLQAGSRAVVEIKP
jgi:hypothetical protein